MGRSKEHVKKVNESVKRIYTSFLYRVRKDDTEIIEKLNSVESRNGYITELIRQDIRKHK